MSVDIRFALDSFFDPAIAPGTDIARELALLIVDKSPSAPRKIYQSICSPPRYDRQLERGWRQHVQILAPFQLVDPPSAESVTGRLTTTDGLHVDDVEIMIFATSYLISFPFLNEEDAPFNRFPLTKRPSLPKGSRKPLPELVGNVPLGGSHRTYMEIHVVRAILVHKMQHRCLQPRCIFYILLSGSHSRFPSSAHRGKCLLYHIHQYSLTDSILYRLYLGHSLSCKRVSLHLIGPVSHCLSPLILTRNQKVVNFSYLGTLPSTSVISFLTALMLTINFDPDFLMLRTS